MNPCGEEGICLCGRGRVVCSHTSWKDILDKISLNIMQKYGEVHAWCEGHPSDYWRALMHVEEVHCMEDRDDDQALASNEKIVAGIMGVVMPLMFLAILTAVVFIWVCL